MGKTGLLKSSIARKVAMSLSAIFLMVFLLQHSFINSLSLCSEDAFNSVSLFMGNNPVVQYVMQPILIFAVIFHFIMGIILELKNNKARSHKYVMNKGNANSSWMSRNMIITGLVILAFMGLHFYDFWIPEIKTKFIEGDWSGMHNGNLRFYHELQAKFEDPIRVGIYIVSFILLSLHLMHGFSSAFQSIGQNNKYTRGLKVFGVAFSIIVPLMFIIIAIYHHLSHI